MLLTSLIVLIVLIQIWLVSPILDPGILGRSVPIMVVLLLAAARQMAVGGRWGLDRRALLPASRLALFVTVPVVLLACAVLIFTHKSFLLSGRQLALTLAFLFIWALGQQFALQTVLLEEGLQALNTGPKAGLLAAGLFALLHLPNPFLTVATFAGGLLWCEIYRRHPNLLPLAASHAICSMALMTAFSREVTGGMRVGYSYLAFWMG